MQNTAVYAPITFEEIEMAMIKAKKRQTASDILGTDDKDCKDKASTTQMNTPLQNKIFQGNQSKQALLKRNS